MNPRLTHKLPYHFRPSPGWSYDRFIVFDALSKGRYMATLRFELRQGQKQMWIRIHLFPGVLTRVALPLRRLDVVTIFTERTPHRFKCVSLGDKLDPARLTEAWLESEAPDGAPVRISRPRLTDRMPARWPHAERPVVDALQQWKQRRWPGKCRSIADVRSRILRELRAPEPEQPADWDRWGGWKGKCFGATGFFRAEHDGRRWWLVDPDGGAFYSLGVDCVTASAGALVAGNEDLYEELPAKDGEYADCWSGGPRPATFDGMRYNLHRALGPQWKQQWMDLTRRRLLRWRFNTVANWSDPEFCRFARLPYVLQLGGFPATQAMIFRDFPDVFSAQYAAACRSFARQLTPLLDDPCLLGYFLRNEPHWAFGRFNMAAEMMQQDQESASRHEFVRWLAERHGEVARLNAAWGVRLPSFDRLLAGGVPEGILSSPRVQEELWEFSRRMIAEYVRRPSEECKRADPNHLNLGVRYAWIAYDELLTAAESFDVFSINAYRMRPEADIVHKCSQAAGRPVIIGEFHIGALDRGLPAAGLRGVRTQTERAAAYRYYVEQGAALPELVGTHHFQWPDQHVGGRFDGENSQVGLVDICQAPYREVTAAARRTHERIYAVAAGLTPPFAREPRELEVRCF